MAPKTLGDLSEVLPGPGSVQLRLVGAEAPPDVDPIDLVDPFVVLDEGGTFSRCLLAEVVGPTKAVIEQVALKLQSDEYPIVASGDPSQLNNRAIAESWSREVGLLERCATGRGTTPRLVEILDRAPGEPASLPPTLFCKRRQIFFRIPCPECGRPLDDLTDSLALEARGLPRYDGSLFRFLGCGGCFPAGSSRAWTLVSDAPDIPGVGDFQHLLHALSRLSHSASSAGSATPDFPCPGCASVGTCYSKSAEDAGEASRVLTPLTFFRSRVVALELLHLRLDEALALAGGRSPKEMTHAALASGRAAIVANAITRIERGPPALFATDPTGKLGLETLRLKLAIFAQLCEALAAVHRDTREPHLALTPRSAMLRIGDHDTGLPALWSGSLRLLGLAQARPRTLRYSDGKDLDWVPYAPPPICDPVFSARRMRQATPKDQPCQVTFRGTSRASGSDRVVLQADIDCDSVDLSGLGERDLLEVFVTQGRPPLSLGFVARPVGLGSAQPRSIESLAVELPEGTRRTLDQLIGQRISRARVTVHPCLHVPCDVESLGLILLHSMVGGREGSPISLAAALADYQRDLESKLATKEAAGLDQVVEEFRETLARESTSGHLRREYLFQDRHLAEQAASTIPMDLWVHALELGFRCIVQARGFGICRDSCDFDPHHPQAKVERILALARDLVRRIDAELFSMPGRDAEMRSAFFRVIDELGIRLPSAPVPESTLDETPLENDLTVLHRAT